MTIILAPHCFYTTGGQNAQQLARKPKKEKGQRGTNNAFDTANILIVLCLSKKLVPIQEANLLLRYLLEGKANRRKKGWLLDREKINQLQ